MNIGIVTTWCEKGASYLSRAYADYFIKNGHKVFIYARGGNIGFQKDGEWGSYNVTFQEKDVYYYLKEPFNLTGKMLDMAEDWSLFNHSPLDRFREVLYQTS